MFSLALDAALLAALSAVEARPGPGLRVRQSITALTQSQIAAFTPYTWYASTGYCNASQTLVWDCGTNCEANPSFEPVASGGDGDSTQYCTWREGSACRAYTDGWSGFVGYDPNLDTVIVSHQGTDPDEMYVPPLVLASIDAELCLQPASRDRW